MSVGCAAGCPWSYERLGGHDLSVGEVSAVSILLVEASRQAREETRGASSRVIWDGAWRPSPAAAAAACRP